MIDVDIERTGRQARALRGVVETVAGHRPTLVEAVARAVPGSDAARAAEALALEWDDQVRAWLREAGEVVAAIEQCLADYRFTDLVAAGALRPR